VSRSTHQLAAVVTPAMATFWHLLDRAADGAFVVRRGSVLACVNPDVPERSLFNSVMYAEPDELLAHLDELQAIYDGLGVQGWTVWAPREDSSVTAELGRRGHRLDGAPDALALNLEELVAPEVGDVDWALDTDLQRLIALNDAAYPWPDGTFARALGRLPADRWHVYVASVDGEPASCLMTYDDSGNTRPEFVATKPDARGEGLSGRLLGLALGHARERGCRTSTLHASKMGQPVYARLGYRVVSQWEMWERRAG
jgi:GNAT superfamily N-acetyltransferase